jgi:hypothetical protein
MINETPGLFPLLRGLASLTARDLILFGGGALVITLVISSIDKILTWETQVGIMFLVLDVLLAVLLTVIILNKLGLI